MKIAVAGCSVSDYTHVKEVYGEHTVNYLNQAGVDAEYLHLAGGGGSNCRAFRLIMDAIIEGTLTENDIVLWQITDSARTELPSAEQSNKLATREITKNKVLESCDSDLLDRTDVITRWKMDSHTWQNFTQDQILHGQYQNCVVNKFGMYKSRNYIVALRKFAKHHGINFKLVYCNMGYPLREFWEDKGQHHLVYSYEDIDLANVWAPYSDHKNWDSEKSVKYRLHPGDNTHFSELGHRDLGDALGIYLLDEIRV